MQFPCHPRPLLLDPRAEIITRLPFVHFRRRVRPWRLRQSRSNSITWGSSRYYRTHSGLSLPITRKQTTRWKTRTREAHVHYVAVVNRVSRWTSVARSRPGRLTPSGTFSVFALIRSFRLSWLPERALCPIPQTPAPPLFLLEDLPRPSMWWNFPRALTKETSDCSERLEKAVAFAIILHFKNSP